MELVGKILDFFQGIFRWFFGLLDQGGERLFGALRLGQIGDSGTAIWLLGALLVGMLVVVALILTSRK